MHRSRIVIDLPSAETERRRSPLEWVRSLFGAELDLRSGREELTVGAAWLIEGLVEAFASLGIHDVVSFVVDEEGIYLDPGGVSDDLPLILRASDAAGVLDREFREMRLVLAHRGEQLETRIDCAVKNGVLLGEAEMTIELSSRPHERPDRTGAPPLHELEVLTERIANELTSALAGARVTRGPATSDPGLPDDPFRT